MNVAINIRKIAKELATRLSPPTRTVRVRVVETNDRPKVEIMDPKDIEGRSLTEIYLGSLAHSQVSAEQKSPEDTSPLYYQSGVSRRTRLILATLFIILTLLLISGIVAAAIPSVLSSILNDIASNFTMTILLALLAFAVLVTIVGFLLDTRPKGNKDHNQFP